MLERVRKRERRLNEKEGNIKPDGEDFEKKVIR